MTTKMIVEEEEEETKKETILHLVVLQVRVAVVGGRLF